MNNHYYAYSLKIKSALELPELCSLPGLSEHCDVSIIWGHVHPDGLTNPTKKGFSFQTSPNEFWLSVANVARFLVRDGREIVIDPINDCDEDSIRTFLLGSCLGALLLQRGFLLLHGNVIQTGQHAVVFAGASGAGKSTLTGMFYKRGYSILADDICAINTEGQIIPGIPRLKLWADAAKHLEIDTSTLQKIRPQVEKYIVPLGHQFYSQPLPLKGIYILNTYNQSEIQLKNITGSAKYLPLMSHIYRPSFQKGMYKERELQIRYAALAHRSTMAKISRPTSGYTLHELANLVEEDWHNCVVSDE